MDGWTDRQIHRQTDRQIDRQIDTLVTHPTGGTAVVSLEGLQNWSDDKGAGWRTMRKAVAGSAVGWVNVGSSWALKQQEWGSNGSITTKSH